MYILKISNDEEQLRKKIKSSDRRKSTKDENSHLCEQSFEVRLKLCFSLIRFNQQL